MASGAEAGPPPIAPPELLDQDATASSPRMEEEAPPLSADPPPQGGVVHALRDAALRCGIDPIAELYNEALRYATDNHLRLARERLQILLYMAPDDADARLTLARVLAAEQRWTEALEEMDAAALAGATVPTALRRSTEDRARAGRTGTGSSGERATGTPLAGDLDVSGRGPAVDSELRSLRNESRRLRSEHAQQSAHIVQLQREVRRWAWLTAAVSTLAIGFIAVTFTFGSDPMAPDPTGVHPPQAASTDAAVHAGSAEPAVAQATAAPPAPPAANAAPAQEATRPAPGSADAVLLAQIEASLRANTATTELTSTVSGNQVRLGGSIARDRELRETLAALRKLAPNVTVDAAGVTNLARRQGTTHLVKPGESLRKIALDYYGNPALSKVLEAHNDLVDKPVPAGATLKIPPID